MVEDRYDLVLRKTAAGQGGMSPFGESLTTHFTFQQPNRVRFAKDLMDSKAVFPPLAMFSTGGVDATEFG